MFKERKSHVQILHETKGYPLKIEARGGYTAYLVGEQPLLEGRCTPIYRFPGGDSLVSDCELKPAK